MKAMMERNRKCLARSRPRPRRCRSAARTSTRTRRVASFEELDLDEENDVTAWTCPSRGGPAVRRWPERRLDPKPWMLKSMRITLTYTKRRAPQQMPMKQQWSAAAGAREAVQEHGPDGVPRPAAGVRQQRRAGAREPGPVGALPRATAPRRPARRVRRAPPQVIEEERRAGKGRHGASRRGRPRAGTRGPHPEDEAP